MKIERIVLANMRQDKKIPETRKPIAPPAVVHRDKKKEKSKKICRKKIKEEKE